MVIVFDVKLEEPIKRQTSYIDIRLHFRYIDEKDIVCDVNIEEDEIINQASWIKR